MNKKLKQLSVQFPDLLSTYKTNWSSEPFDFLLQEEKTVIDIDTLDSLSKNKEQISFLKKVLKASFSDFGNFNRLEDWYGFRPFRPNSIPLICEVKKYGNLLLNTGHGSLGWTMSAGSGKILADLVSDSKGRKFNFLNEELS